MVLKTVGVTKNYYRKTSEANYFRALDKTDIAIKEGTLTVILGRSGGGKSTFLNILAGILKPTEGKVLYGETDIYGLGDKELSLFRNKHIGFIPQIHSVLKSLTAGENITLPMSVYGSPQQEDCADILMEKLGITDLKNVSAADLSGGEMRRVSIARALVMKPDALLADEPTADLDDENTKTVLELMRAAADGGAAVVIVTHETDAVKYADTVYRMNSGRLEEDLTIL